MGSLQLVSAGSVRGRIATRKSAPSPTLTRSPGATTTCADGSRWPRARSQLLPRFSMAMRLSPAPMRCTRSWRRDIHGALGAGSARLAPGTWRSGASRRSWPSPGPRPKTDGVSSGASTAPTRSGSPSSHASTSTGCSAWAPSPERTARGARSMVLASSRVLVI
ncbi:MAG: hypothetical protein U1F43_22320 [Myxococcota bacterium]